jgi:eIF-2B alpha/beta/delta-like uncharacterized protein
MQNVESVANTIKSVKVQGAKNIAIYALGFLRKFCKRYGFGLKFEIAAYVLEEARPTAVVLHNCIEILKKSRNLRTIDSLIKRLNNVTNVIAKKGSKLIKKNYKIMTHCHSGEALAVIKQAWKQKKKISVIATETEPLEQGIKTVKELAKLKIPVTLITDSAVGHFMKDVDCVIVGADAIRKKEGLINKIGTCLLALAAKENKKPFYVVANTIKFDKRKKLIIEERPAREVYQKLKSVKIRNPAFDITPLKYITTIVTEKGILKPERIRKMLK